MLKNYLKIALRNLVQQKLYSGLNVFGLALGLACTLLIYFFVRHELSYDQFLENADRVFRVVEWQPGNVFLGKDRFVVTPASLSGALTDVFPEVEYATTFTDARVLLRDGQDYYYEDGLWADSSFFDVLAYPLLAGDAATVLDDPGHMLVTESLGRKIFGTEDPMGRTLEIEQRESLLTFEIAGILADLPETSQLAFEYILPISANQNYLRNLEHRTNNSFLTYFRLREGADPDALQTKMPEFVRTYVGEEESENYVYIVESLLDVHLYSDVNFDKGVQGDIRYVLIFSAIGLIILLLACVNYMNLAVARSMKRAREVGLRQAIGAQRMQIAGQFISESVLMAAMALVLGLMVTVAFLPVFSDLVDRELTVNWGSPWFVPGLIGLVGIVGLISGSYPALYMAKLRPITILKGDQAGGGKRSGLQRALIVLQYTASIALVAGGIVIFQQLRYVQAKEVGYNRERIVTIPLRGPGLLNRLDTIQEEMRKVPNVVGVTPVSHLPTNIGSSQGIDSWEGRQEGQELSIYQANVGYEFFDVFEIQMVAGRPFSPEIASDTIGALVLNETAVRALGWSPEEALGKRVKKDGHVIGVMRDFHLHSFHLPIAPLMLSMTDGWYGHLAVRIGPENAGETADRLTGIVAELTPYPLAYEFLEDVFDDLYKADLRLGQSIGYFALLALLVASLGLFGLAAYSTERRSKEIGVRRVLGAPALALVTLLSREFLVLVAVSIVFAIPVAYFAMGRWLENFAYHVDLGAGVFIVTAVLVVVIAIMTVSYQTLRAAFSNPVEALRYE